MAVGRAGVPLTLSVGTAEGVEEVLCEAVDVKPREPVALPLGEAVPSVGVADKSEEPVALMEVLGSWEGLTEGEEVAEGETVRSAVPLAAPEIELWGVAEGERAPLALGAVAEAGADIVAAAEVVPFSARLGVAVAGEPLRECSAESVA